MLRPPIPAAPASAAEFTWIRWACWGWTRRQAPALIAAILFATCCLPSRAGEWQSLFDGKSLEGWRITDFAGHGEVSVESGRLTLHSGVMLTGVSWTNTLP